VVCFASLSNQQLVIVTRTTASRLRGAHKIFRFDVLQHELFNQKRAMDTPVANRQNELNELYKTCMKMTWDIGVAYVQTNWVVNLISKAMVIYGIRKQLEDMDLHGFPLKYLGLPEVGIVVPPSMHNGTINSHPAAMSRWTILW